MSGNETHTPWTGEYRTIVIPTDGSDGADYAAGHALTIAEAFDATVHVVSVYQTAGSVQRDQLRTSPEELAVEAVETIAERARKRDIKVRTATPSSGTPDEALLMYIEEVDADMAVIGTHGRTGIDQVLFGSVAEELVRNSPVPVLTVRPPQWED